MNVNTSTLNDEEKKQYANLCALLGDLEIAKSSVEFKKESIIAEVADLFKKADERTSNQSSN